MNSSTFNPDNFSASIPKIDIAEKYPINLATPLNDEHIRGLLGRFARVNGFSSSKSFTHALSQANQVGAESPAFLIADLLAFDRKQFVAEHTMLPVIAPIHRLDYDGSDTKYLALLSYHGMWPKNKMRWCPVCCKSDMNKWAVSYWRRAHQLPGIEWCNEHKTPTIITTSSNAFFPPGHPNTHGPSSIAYDDLASELDSPRLQQFTLLMQSLLQLTKPYSITSWTKVVSEACKAAGLRIGEIGKRPVVSDLIQQQFPSTWLARHMPEVLDKRPTHYIRKVDGATLEKLFAYPVLICVAILTVLFENHQDALRALDQASQSSLVQSNSTDLAVQAFCKGLNLAEACHQFKIEQAVLEASLRERLKSGIKHTSDTLQSA